MLGRSDGPKFGGISVRFRGVSIIPGNTIQPIQTGRTGSYFKKAAGPLKQAACILGFKDSPISATYDCQRQMTAAAT